MNFKEFEELIESGIEEITLSENIILEKGEEDKFIEGIEINRDNLIIDGKNHTIDGNSEVSILSIKGSNITLKNIIFKNGYSEDFCGAINNHSNDLRINHCQFIDNESEDFGNAHGGAIYNAPDSSLIIEKSVFKDNGSDYGGAIYIDSNSSLEINNSVFESNTVEFEGAAIYNKGELIIDNSLFTRNAAFKGGAIYNEKDLIIKDCKFINNTAGEGNDIFTENMDKLNISNSVCQFINNDNILR